MEMRTVHVLLVEDDEVDVMSIQRAFKKRRIANPIVVAHDGIEALETLRGLEGRSPLPRPYIILLDLNMPRMDGFEFLQELRADPEHKDAVVFVLTTSELDRDRGGAYEKNVAGYVSKTNVGRDFTDLMTMLEAYWKVVALP